MHITETNPPRELRVATSRYATMSSRASRWTLCIFTAFALLSVATSLSRYRISFKDRVQNASDLELYWAEVHRVANGESYYQAASEELTARGHPTINLFNWRTPLPMWLLAKLPDPEYGRWILASLGVCLLVFGVLASYREGSLHQGLWSGIFLSGMTILCLMGNLYVSPILWASVLLGLSLCAYCFDRVGLAVFLGTAAIIFRELAMPYCLLMVAIAVWRRQRSELFLWSLGLAGFAIYYFVHAWHVARFAGTDQIASTNRWTQFNGLPAVIGSAQNGFLLLFPQWVTAVYLACALLGLGGWHSLFGLRVAGTAILFLTTFAIIGRDVNQYWGTLVTSVLCLGAARAPASFCELMRAAARP